MHDRVDHRMQRLDTALADDHEDVRPARADEVAYLSEHEAVPRHRRETDEVSPEVGILRRTPRLLARHAQHPSFERGGRVARVVPGEEHDARARLTTDAFDRDRTDAVAVEYRAFVETTRDVGQRFDAYLATYAVRTMDLADDERLVVANRSRG